MVISSNRTASVPSRRNTPLERGSGPLPNLTTIERAPCKLPESERLAFAREIVDRANDWETAGLVAQCVALDSRDALRAWPIVVRVEQDLADQRDGTRGTPLEDAGDDE